MKATEHLLACLSEECVEVSKEAHKALRFGPGDRNPMLPNAPTQREQICTELNDLIAVAEMLVEHGIIPPWRDEEKIAAKKRKVAKYLHYAMEVGTLDPEAAP